MEKLELYKLKREPKHTTQQHPIRYKEEHARFSNHQLSQSGDWFKMHLSKLNSDSVMIITLF